MSKQVEIPNVEFETEDEYREAMKANRAFLSRLVTQRDQLEKSMHIVRNQLRIKADNKPMNTENMAEMVMDLGDLDYLWNKLTGHGPGEAPKVKGKKVLGGMELEEKELNGRIEEVCMRFPFYRDVLQYSEAKIRLSQRLLAELDPWKSKYASSLIQVCGLNPNKIKGKKRVTKSAYKKDMGEIIAHVPSLKGKGVDYIVLTNKDVPGDRKTEGYVLPCCLDLKKQLLGVWMPERIKSCLRWEPCTEEEAAGMPPGYVALKEKTIEGEKQEVLCKAEVSSPWVHMYLQKKAMYSQSEKITSLWGPRDPETNKPKRVKMAWKDTPPGYRHKAAMKFVAQRFIMQVYNLWRGYEGLEIHDPWAQAKLGKQPHTGEPADGVRCPDLQNRTVHSRDGKQVLHHSRKETVNLNK